jgi:hypothetical protein
VEPTTESDQPGALVISLDFELHWGVRDHVGPHDALYGRLAEARRAAVDLAALFASRNIRCTWATVGFLFASTRHEVDSHLPKVRPAYEHAGLNPYVQAIGLDEKHDPEHLAGSLVDIIAGTPGQEVGSHTFSHYYCLEPGQNEAAFRADLGAAQSIAQSKGLALTSLVLPRNQWNPAYAGAVLDLGFSSFRGPQRRWSHGTGQTGRAGILRRAARLADSYVGISPPPTTAWSQVLQPTGLCDIPASAFLRPFEPSRKQLEPLRLARLHSGLSHAARRRRIFHLWWHPHNFSQYRSENFSNLERILDEFDRLSATEGMQSLSMKDVTTVVTRPSSAVHQRRSSG